MKKLFLVPAVVLVLGAIVLRAGAADPAPMPAAKGSPVIEHCLISLIEEVQLPGKEPGVLAVCAGKEGMKIKAGDVLGRIDDIDAKYAKRVKMAELATAKEQATNDVNVRYAIKATEFAKSEYEKAFEATTKVKGSIAQIDLNRFKLAWQKSELQIEQAQMEQKVAKLTTGTKQAEVDAAENNIQRRQIKSPLDGEIISVYKHLGEWVPPGETVFHIVRLDRLRVEGYLNISQYNPAQINGRDVIIDTELVGQKIRFRGKITFVNPRVEAGGSYQVWAEVPNREENGEWVLRPGLTATMTINLGAGGRTADTR
jgi:multidrug resistance efflux pump